MKLIINSPLGGVMDESMAVITVIGRTTGNLISTPINVIKTGSKFTVICSRDRTWWRNLPGQQMRSNLISKPIVITSRRAYNRRESDQHKLSRERGMPFMWEGGDSGDSGVCGLNRRTRANMQGVK